LKRICYRIIMNKKPTRCTIVLESLNFIVFLFRSTRFGHFCAHYQEPPNSAHTASSQRVSSGCLCLPALVCHYYRFHVSQTLAPIIMSLLILHIQPPVTVCRWVGCVFQLWSVTTVAFMCHRLLRPSSGAS
jgi:hypothetical protein